MSFEAYRDANSLSQAEALKMYDDIPEDRIAKIEYVANSKGHSPETLKNSIEVVFEDGNEEVRERAAQLLVVLSNPGYSDAVAKELEDKMQEFVDLVTKI